MDAVGVLEGVTGVGVDVNVKVVVGRKVEVGVNDGAVVNVIVDVIEGVNVAVEVFAVVGVRVKVGVGVDDEVIVGMGVEVGVKTDGFGVLVLFKIWSVLVMVNVGVSVTNVESGANVMAINPIQ